MPKTLTVDVRQCEQTGVSIGTSDDILGLTLEADSIGRILDAAIEVVPELLEYNHSVELGDEVDVVANIHASAVHLDTPAAAVMPPARPARFTWPADVRQAAFA